MTTIVLMPVLYRREDEGLLDGSLNPERQRQKLESLLAQGYKVKIANEFEYEHIHFTHYVLEKETGGAFDIGYKSFLAGLRAGTLQWHDLRKNPKDLPDTARGVWTNAGAGYHDDDGWWDDFGRLQGVIAWCEPKFEEE